MQAAVNHSIYLKRERSLPYEIRMHVSQTLSKFPLKGGTEGRVVVMGVVGRVGGVKESLSKLLHKIVTIELPQTEGRRERCEALV